MVDDTAYYLALGAARIAATVDPEMIVFGGGMMAAGESFRAKIEEYVRRFGLPFPTKTVKMAFADLGSDAGFIGAAGCAPGCSSAAASDAGPPPHFRGHKALGFRLALRRHRLLGESLERLSAP